jgi:hypothetical protein
MTYDDDNYPDGFWHWMGQNEHIYAAFRVKAFQMALKGRKRYSARTIIEVLRWETDLRENKPLFKISNNMVPGMSRLFMTEYGGRYPGFFELRQ